MSRARRSFTHEEATSTLPFVRRVAQDIVRIQAEISDIYTELSELVGPAAPAFGGGVAGRTSRSKRSGRGESQGHSGRLRTRLLRLFEHREAWIRELEGVGCEYRETDFGLVYFPGDSADAGSALGWRPGDLEIASWSDLRGRASLTEI